MRVRRARIKEMGRGVLGVGWGAGQEWGEQHATVSMLPLLVSPQRLGRSLLHCPCSFHSLTAASRSLPAAAPA